MVQDKDINSQIDFMISGYPDSRYNHRQDDSTVQVIADRINSLHEDVGEIRESLKDSMKEMSGALTKLVQIEERQVFTNQAIERALKISEKAHTRIDDCEDEVGKKFDALEARVDTLEKAAPMQGQVTKWVMAAVWGAAGLGAMYICKMLGIL